MSENFSVFRQAFASETFNGGQLSYAANESGWIAQVKQASSERISLQIEFQFANAGPHTTLSGYKVQNWSLVFDNVGTWKNHKCWACKVPVSFALSSNNNASISIKDTFDIVAPLSPSACT